MHYKKSLTILLLLIAVSAEAIEQVNDRQIAEYTKQKGTVVLNFWATWCAPCVEEIPALIRLKKEFKDIELIGVSMDELSEVKLVEDFVKKQKMNYTVVLRNGENFETMVNSIDPEWIGALPATFVFRNGKRVYSKVGLLDEEELTKILRISARVKTALP